MTKGLILPGFALILYTACISLCSIGTCNVSLIFAIIAGIFSSGFSGRSCICILRFLSNCGRASSWGGGAPSSGWYPSCGGGGGGGGGPYSIWKK